MEVLIDFLNVYAKRTPTAEDGLAEPDRSSEAVVNNPSFRIWKRRHAKLLQVPAIEWVSQQVMIAPTSTAPSARSRAIDLVHHLDAHGYSQFRDLLP